MRYVILIALAVLLLAGCEREDLESSLLFPKAGTSNALPLRPIIMKWADGTTVTRYAGQGSVWRVQYPDGVTCYGRGEYLTCMEKAK